MLKLWKFRLGGVFPTGLGRICITEIVGASEQPFEYVEIFAE